MLDRHALARLRQLLLARDAEQIHQGIELIRSLADPSVVDLFLDGVTWDPSLKSLRRGWSSSSIVGSLRPNALFEDTGPATPWHLQAMLGLVSTGLGAKGAALARSTLHLGLAREEVFDLRWLSGFTSLTALAIDAGSIEGLEALAAMPDLATLTLDADQNLDVSALKGCKALRTLTLKSSKTVVGLEGLGALPPLDALEMDAQNVSLAGIEGLVARSLTLHLRHVTDVDSLEKTSVGELSLMSRSITRLGPMSPSLTKLTVNEVTALQERFLPRLPLLREFYDLTSRAVSLVPTVEATPALEVLRSSASIPEFYDAIARLPALQHLEVLSLAPAMGALRGHPALKTLVARAMHATVTTLGDMPEALVWIGYGAPGEGLLHLDGTSLENLHGFERFGCVKHVSLRGCKRLTTLSGIEALKSLEVLDVRECGELTDVAALAGLDALKAVAVAGVAAADEDFPDAMRWTLSRALKVDLDALRRRTKPVRAKSTSARKRPVPDALAEVWAGIELGLRAIPVKADKVADLCRAAGDVSLYNTLLEGISVSGASLMIPPKLARGGRTAAKAHLLRRLLAEAPDGCAAAVQVRDSVETLRLVGNDDVRRRRWASRAAVDVSPLGAFTRLRELTVDDAPEIIGVAGLAKAPSLRTLTLGWGVSLASLRDLAGSPLESLTLQGSLREMNGVEALRLRSLCLRSVVGSLRALGGCPTLETFTLTASMDPTQRLPLAFFAALPALRTLSVRGDRDDLRGLPSHLVTFDTSNEVNSTAGSAEAVALQSLGGGQLMDCRELPPNLERWTTLLQNGCRMDGPVHPRLVKLTVSVPQSLDHLGWVTRFPSLRSLTILDRMPTDLGPLLQLPALESLHFGCYGQCPDLTPLEAHPSLISITGNQLGPEDLPPRFRTT